MKKPFISFVYLELWFYVFKSRKNDNDFCKYNSFNKNNYKPSTCTTKLK